MKIGIIGTGYVGLPTGVGLAELGHNVICIDKDSLKIESLKKGKITLFEEGLEDLFNKNTKSGNLKFTTSMEDGIKDADIVIIAVGTPPHPITKEADMKYIHLATVELAKYLKKYTIVATKSTVPIGTGDVIEELISKTNPSADFDVISLPEFLREGFAVYDFFNPDRIIVGTNKEKVKETIIKLYEPLKHKTNILFVNRRSAETIKYASNSFLAMKIHYINEMADFCKKTGADIFEVAKGMGLDSRIGDKFLNAGPGYGGSCFPKDTLAMSYMAKQNNVEIELINTAINGNIKRKKNIAKSIMSMVNNDLNAKISILGLAFKEGTDDCRESPAIEVIQELLDNGFKNIIAYDPKAINMAYSIIGDKISYADNMQSIAKDADVLVVLTEWKEFKTIDLKEVAKIMKSKNIVDYRNLFDIAEVVKNNFKYIGVGKEI